MPEFALVTDLGTGARELTRPVLECTPDGNLNPLAVGWSREPLHRCNLHGHFLRKKRWEYWCVTTDTHLLAVTYANLDYLGLANVWVYEFGTEPIGKSVVVPLALGFSPQPERPFGADLHWDGLGLHLAIRETEDSTTIETAFRDPRRGPVEAEITIARPPSHDSLNVLVPWALDRFQFTSKHHALRADGMLRIGDDDLPFAQRNNAFASFDFGRGVWPFRTTWNWGAGSGVLPDGRTLGLQLGGKWTDGTGQTENGVLLGGRLHKIDEDLRWSYDRTDWMAPWKVEAPSGGVDLVLEPFHERNEHIELIVAGTETHQCFGHWYGNLTVDGERITVDGMLGWAEEFDGRW